MQTATSDPSIPLVIAGILAVLLTILKESAPAISRWIKSKANASAQIAENQTASSAKKNEVVAEAQLFLSDVGKNYFTQLEKQSENLQIRLSDYEKVVADLRDQNNKLFMEREKLRIDIARLQEEESEGKTKIAEKTSEGAQLNDKIKQLDSDNKDLIAKLDQQKNLNEVQKQDVQRLEKELADAQSENKKANDQLEEASRRLDDAYSRFDQERSRAERLEKENSALRKTSDIPNKEN